MKTLRYDRDRQIKFKSLITAITPSTTNLLVSSDSEIDKLRRKIENAVDGLPSASECFNYLYKEGKTEMVTQTAEEFIAELEDIVNEAPDLYEALAEEDQSLIK